MDDALYDELWRTEQDHWWFVGRRRIVRSLVAKYATGASAARLRICELGCGTGGNIASWANEHEVIGVDASSQALRYARQRLGPRVLSGRLPDDIPLDAESFDVVLLTDVFEHIEDDLSSARTALSLVREGGILLATVPAYQWLYSPRDRHHQHFRRYGKGQFRRLFAQPGVRVELLSYYNSFLFPPAACARLYTKFFGARDEAGDLRIPAAPLNRLLSHVFAAETGLLTTTGLPFGLSLITVVRKTQRAANTIAA